MTRRLGISALFLALLAAAFRFAGSSAAASDEPGIQRYRAAANLVRSLISDPGLRIDDTDRSDLSGASCLLSTTTSYWSKASPGNRELLLGADRECAATLLRVASDLDRVTELERLEVPAARSFLSGCARRGRHQAP